MSNFCELLFTAVQFIDAAEKSSDPKHAGTVFVN